MCDCFVKTPFPLLTVTITITNDETDNSFFWSLKETHPMSFITSKKLRTTKNFLRISDVIC